MIIGSAIIIKVLLSPRVTRLFPSDYNDSDQSHLFPQHACKPSGVMLRMEAYEGNFGLEVVFERQLQPSSEQAA